MSTENRRVLVIGAGIVGLNTALKIQEDLPDVSVTVKAEKFHPHTTSNVAAGIFLPTAGFRAPTEELKDFWLSESWKYFYHIRTEEGAGNTGIVELPLYLLSSGNSKTDLAKTHIPFLAKHSVVHRKCTQRELDLFQPKGRWQSGTYSHTLVVDCGRHLPWAEARFTARGGRLQMGRVDSLEELKEEGWDLVVNCAGFGAKELCSDGQMSANRGQVMKVWAPWVKIAVYADANTIIIPGVDLVTVGRTAEMGNDSLAPDQHDKQGIWQRATEVMPNLQKATVIKDSVGIRPTRTAMRVEKETLGNGLKVVHNYGHCGYGVMSSYGCAVTASKLAREALDGHMANTHL